MISRIRRFIYQPKTGQAAAHFQVIGELIQKLLVESAPAYAQQEVYHLLQRVYAENYVEVSKSPAPTPP